MHGGWFMYMWVDVPNYLPSQTVFIQQVRCHFFLHIIHEEDLDKPETLQNLHCKSNISVCFTKHQCSNVIFTGSCCTKWSSMWAQKDVGHKALYPFSVVIQSPINHVLIQCTVTDFHETEKWSGSCNPDCMTPDSSPALYPAVNVPDRFRMGIKALKRYCLWDSKSSACERAQSQSRSLWEHKSAPVLLSACGHVSETCRPSERSSAPDVGFPGQACSRTLPNIVLEWL